MQQSWMMTVSLRYSEWEIINSLYAFLLRKFTVAGVTIRMEQAAVSVDEDVMCQTVSVCAEIAALPADGLQTDLTVTLSTTDGSKAGL